MSFQGASRCLNEGSPDCIFDCVAGHLILSMGQFYRDFILNIVSIIWYLFIWLFYHKC